MSPDKKRADLLQQIVVDTLWMARRYAHNRMTFSPNTVNQAIDTALALGLPIQEDSGFGMYADDGGLGKWIPAEQRFERYTQLTPENTEVTCPSCKTTWTTGACQVTVFQCLNCGRTIGLRPVEAAGPQP